MPAYEDEGVVTVAAAATPSEQSNSARNAKSWTVDRLVPEITRWQAGVACDKSASGGEGELRTSSRCRAIKSSRPRANNTSAQPP